jgi:hypothetical protein
MSSGCEPSIAVTVGLTSRQTPSSVVTTTRSASVCGTEDQTGAGRAHATSAWPFTRRTPFPEDVIDLIGLARIDLTATAPFAAKVARTD